jgi:DNA-binding MarR family transcriptional regulator
MSLENDLQQKFRNESQKAMLNILYTSYFIQDKMNMVFKHYDITRQQFNVLRILRGQHPGHASVNLIRDRMLDKMSDASRIVERLRLKELVVRKNAEKDKRAVEVSITETGLRLLEEMEKPVQGFEDMFNCWTKDETIQLNTLLDKFREVNKVVEETSHTESALH